MAVKAYSAEVKADAVALVLSEPGRTISSVAQDLGVSRETLRIRVRDAQAAVGAVGTSQGRSSARRAAR